MVPAGQRVHNGGGDMAAGSGNRKQTVNWKLWTGDAIKSQSPPPPPHVLPPGSLHLLKAPNCPKQHPLLGVCIFEPVGVLLIKTSTVKIFCKVTVQVYIINEQNLQTQAWPYLYLSFVYEIKHLWIFSVLKRFFKSLSRKAQGWFFFPSPCVFVCLAACIVLGFWHLDFQSYITIISFSICDTTQKLDKKNGVFSTCILLIWIVVFDYYFQILLTL